MLPLVVPALLCGALLAGCAEPERPVPKTRLVDTDFVAPTDPPLARKEQIALNDVSYPTFTSSKPVLMRKRCLVSKTSEALRDCVITIPPTMGRWTILETARVKPPTAAMPEPGTIDPTQPTPTKAPDPRSHASEERLRFAVLRDRGRAALRKELTLPERAAQQILGYAAPDVDRRDIVVPVGEVPSGAELRFAIGIEEPAWHIDSAPVDFVVRARQAGKDKEIFRQGLDPARNEADRGWRTASVSLGELGSEPLELVFSTPHSSPDDRRPSLPLWGDPTIVAGGPPPGRPRRIVLVSLDTLRAKSMSLYGYELETTPAFTRLAREGTVFERAFTAFSNTLGSHMSMFTGLYPANHKVSAKHPRLDLELPTLAERLRAAGYETGAFTENALLSAPAGFRRGFAHYYENKSVDDGAGDAEGTFRDALAWMKQQGDLPFFAFVHTYEVHAPYDPPERARKWFEGEGKQSATQVARRLYEQEIRHLDDLLKELVAGLAKLGPPEELLLVVTADHGEEFYEHRSSTHTQLFDEVMHVPMFMRWPGTIPAGRQVEAAVSLVDIVPTVLDLAGAPPVAQTDGVSLVPLLEGKQVARNSVFGQTPRQKIPLRSARYVARSATAKCMVAEEDGWVECFDLTADPEEKKPLAPDSNPALAKLHEQALEYRRIAMAEGDMPAPGATSEHVDEETQEKLRVLGYVE